MTPPLFFFGRRRRAARGTGESDSVAGVTDVNMSSAQSPQEPAESGSGTRTGRAEPAEPEVPTLDAERLALVDAALETWREELADLGGVASLDAFTQLDGVVDLTAAHPSGLAQLYAGRTTHLSNLVREHSAQGRARRRLRAVAARTDVLARQYGVAPVYLAIGVASWTEEISTAQQGSQVSSALGHGGRADFLGPRPASPADERIAAPADTSGGSARAASSATSTPSASSALPAPHDGSSDPGGPRRRETRVPGRMPIPVPLAKPGVVRRVHAPVLLRPVRLAGTSGDASLTLDPSIEVNPVLVRALRAYGSTVDIEAIARAALSVQGFTPRSALARISALGQEYLPGFDLHEQLVVGAFVHPGQALVEDFDATLERARNSALVAALAGDAVARAALDVELPAPNPTDRATELERGVGDLDPAQLDAIEAVGSGASLLLDAPPGSDVAATLAAVAADAAASGRVVLHVPATSADGHAVARVLEDLGLGELVVDLTEDVAWRRHAAEGIKEGMGALPVDLDVTAIVDVRDRLTAVRARLARYIDALHERREPWGVSAHDALQKLAELTSGRVRERTRARVEPGRLERLDAGGHQRARELLERAHRLGALTAAVRTSAWNGITITDIDQATDTVVRLVRLADELLPAILGHSAEVSETTGITQAGTLAQWCEQLDMFDGVRESLDVFVPEIFERSAADMVIATATKRWREERNLEMSGSSRRRFVRLAKDLVRPGREVADLHGELVKVQQRREVWRRHDPDGGWPRLPHGLDAMQRTAGKARSAVAELQPVLGSVEGSTALMDTPLPELLTRVKTLADDDETAQKLPEINRVVGELGELGLDALVDDLAQRHVAADQLDEELTYCWWSSLLAQLLREDPDLGGLDAVALASLSSSLRELDALQSDSLPGPVAQAYARRVRAAVDEDKAGARELYVALSREDGQPLSEIIAAHPMALTAKPVWIVPPTLVPQVFAPDAVVDLVVLDATAQMPVAQVMPAFVRAEQVLVVGDPRRATTGLAAELGPLLPRVTLPTGRNTLDTRIAAFLAANGYEGVVEAIPSPPGGRRLHLELVDGRGMPAPGQTAVESVPVEVERVVDLVIDHALVRPDSSLGVVALNARHAEELRRAISAAVVGSPALEDFFATGIDEPFEVVELAEARALRRDQVIVAVGYAKTPHGRTMHSFGSLAEAGGMVGMVEALCASRGQTTVVSSLAPEDLDPDRLRAPGTRLLREVLMCAAGGGDNEPSEGGAVPDRLLVDLAEHLWRHGLVVVPRYGCEGGPRIPLAIGHPDCPGELLVAVLTDDDQYVAEPSLRRRDRYWVERLQQRGWRVHMAYSAGVFVDPEGEARLVEEQVLSVLRARAEAEAPRSPAPVPPRVEEPEEPAPAPPSPRSASPTHRRGSRPPIAQGLPLQAYSDDQLDELVAWIRSDGVERNEAEEIDELRETLALHRRGAGIDAVLTNAVRRTR